MIAAVDELRRIADAAGGLYLDDGHVRLPLGPRLRAVADDFERRAAELARQNRAMHRELVRRRGEGVWTG